MKSMDNSSSSAAAVTSGKFYDPLSRNPLYCGADQAVVFELNSLVNHFHPSVSLFARRLLKGEEDVGYNGDPLVDFTLARFLERFVYKNPKKVNRWDGVRGLPSRGKTFSVSVSFPLFPL